MDTNTEQSSPQPCDPTTERYWLQTIVEIGNLRDRISAAVTEDFVDELAQDNAIAILDYLDRCVLQANANARRMEMIARGRG